MIIKDNYGEVTLDPGSKWGANTQRSLQNFKIGTEKMPSELIVSIIEIKGACANVSGELGTLDLEISQAIVKACDALLLEYDANLFPLSIWQTGSGTQTNMNVNEVVAHYASNIAGVMVHPNDHVNASQSSNDVFPTALHIMGYTMVVNHLIPRLDQMIKVIKEQVALYTEVYKVGRTHLQDAIPMSYSQELSGWLYSLETDKSIIEDALKTLAYLPIGATAIGTGLNSKYSFDKNVVKSLSQRLGIHFEVTENKFSGLSSKQAILNIHSALNTLATDLFKIANDIRWLASGPRCGLGEIYIPSNEAGSSIMPGKVNPTQSEALMMVCTQVFGNNATMTFANANGNFQLNVMMPLMGLNLNQSIRLLGDAIESFTDKCLVGMIPNVDKMTDNLNRSLMISTKLNPILGYDVVTKLVKEAESLNTSVQEVIVNKGLLSENQLKELLDPRTMVYVHEKNNHQ